MALGRALRIAVLLALSWPALAAGAAAPPLLIPAAVPPAERTQMEAIARDALVSTRMEGEPLFMRPELFEYLLDHPEFTSHVTQALDIGRYRIWRERGELWLDEGWGTKGRFSVAHAAPGLRMYHARGAYQPGFLPEVRGEAVAIFEYAFRPDGGGRTRVACKASAYVLIENRIVRALGRLALPLVQAKADKEAWRLLRNLGRASHAIESDPADVYLKVSQRPDVPRRELAEFRALLRLPSP